MGAPHRGLNAFGAHPPAARCPVAGVRRPPGRREDPPVRRPGSEGVSGFTSELLEDDGQRAEPGEGGLEEVEAHEGGEPEPIGIDGIGQAEGEQNDGAGKGKYDAFDGHNGNPRYPVAE